MGPLFQTSTQPEADITSLTWLPKSQQKLELMKLEINMKVHQFVNTNPKEYPLTGADKPSIVKGTRVVIVKGNIYYYHQKDPKSSRSIMNPRKKKPLKVHKNKN